jgi:tetratricopeptide (TPR) repeat protein
VIKKFPDYTLVFFDNTEVLYINRRHYPAIAEKDQLDIDPFDLFGKDIDALINLKGKDLLLKDLSKLTEIYPDCLATNQILAMFYNKEGRYQKAIPYADKLIQNYPETPMGYRLKGIALKGLKLCDEAIPFFEIALKRSNEEGKRDIYKQMAYAYVEKKEYNKAYTSFRKGVSIFSPETTYKDLFDLSSAALLSGKVQEAIFFLRLASKKVPAQDNEFEEKIKRQLSRLGYREVD